MLKKNNKIIINILCFFLYLFHLKLMNINNNYTTIKKVKNKIRIKIRRRILYNYTNCKALLNLYIHSLSFFFALRALNLKIPGKILVIKGEIIEVPRL